MEPLWSHRAVAAIDTSLERIAMPSAAEFQRNYVDANLAVIVTGALTNWMTDAADGKAITWDLERFQSILGDKIMSNVFVSDNGMHITCIGIWSLLHDTHATFCCMVARCVWLCRSL